MPATLRARALPLLLLAAAATAACQVSVDSGLFDDADGGAGAADGGASAGDGGAFDAGAIDGAAADDAAIDATTAPALSQLAPAHTISIGGNTMACAIDATRSVKCWADSETFRTPKWTTPVAASDNPISVAAGLFHACALTAVRGVVCWGSSQYVGDGSLRPDSGAALRSPPKIVAGLERDVVSLAAGSWFTCAVQRGRVLCWGDGTSGQLGDGTKATRNVPAPVLAIDDAVEVAAEDSVACARRASGAVACWGWNGGGGAGGPKHEAQATPLPVANLPARIERVAPAFAQSCAQAAGGAVLCWGDGEYNPPPCNIFGCDDAGAPPPLPARAIPGLERVALLGRGSMALVGATTARAWRERFSMSDTVLPSTPTELESGGSLACGRFADGVYCWGDNTYGGLGAEGLERSVVPVRVQGI